MLKYLTLGTVLLCATAALQAQPSGQPPGGAGVQKTPAQPGGSPLPTDPWARQWNPATNGGVSLQLQPGSAFINPPGNMPTYTSANNPMMADGSECQDWQHTSADRSIEVCSRIIQGNPLAAWAYFQRGMAYYNKRDLSRAIADYNRTIELNPQHFAAYNNRGNAYADVAQLDRALADYDKAIKLDANMPLPYNGRANVYNQKGDLNRALANYDKAIELDSSNPLPYNGRGNVYKAKGDLDRALVDYNKAIELDPRNPFPYNGRGNIYKEKGDLDRALVDYNKAIELDSHFIVAYQNRANLSDKQGHLDRALTDLRKIVEQQGARVPGSELPQSQLVALDAHITELLNVGKYTDALPIANQYAELAQRVYGDEHAQYARALGLLGKVYLAQAKFLEAERLLKRAVLIRERVVDSNPADFTWVLNDLAYLYLRQGRKDEAELLFNRGFTLLEGSNSPPQDLARLLSNLGMVQEDMGKHEEAEHTFRRALDLPNLRPVDIATIETSLAWTLYRKGQFDEAETLSRRSLSRMEASLPAGYPGFLQSLNNLALILQAQARYEEAEATYKRALTVLSGAEDAHHPDLALIYGNLAWLSFLRQDMSSGLAYIRRATSILMKLGRQQPFLRRLASGSGDQSTYFAGHVLAARRAGPADPALTGEAFEMAQWAMRTAAADAIAQLAARHAKGEGPLATLVRQRQDLEHEREAADRDLSDALGQGNAELANAARKKISAIDNQLGETSAELSQSFPEYAEIVAPEALSITATQALLASNEVLLMIVEAPHELLGIPAESYAWFVAKSEVRWITLPLSSKAIAEDVAALRCGLDATRWDDVDSAQRCKGLVKASRRTEMVTTDGKNESIAVLPFDLARAHQLYEALLGQAADLIKDKHLLVVSSGPLASLPFNVLVTEPPKVAIPYTLAQYRDVAWLGARTAITVLPSVSSLKALRRFAKESQSTKPFLGIGNPLLDGRQGDANEKERAELARTKRCSLASRPQQIASTPSPRSVRNFAPVFHGTQADIELIRQQAPLPETADELCEVGRRLGVPVSEILLGADATEARLKDLSEEGRLADYAILHFATHGALSGDVEGSAEPGLILTPPPKGTTDPEALKRDDGFLTASEIATLKLDADWVVLSACNTAGAQGEGEGAEVLSGVARAFFYAGARALLVSHWRVESDAAVKLTTRAFAELKAHPEIGRSEAFRRSMKGMIETGSLAEAHPSQWAPFVVVGEGAAGIETTPSQRTAAASSPTTSRDSETSVAPTPTRPATVDPRTTMLMTPPTSGPSEIPAVVPPTVPPAKMSTTAKSHPKSKAPPWTAELWKNQNR